MPGEPENHKGGKGRGRLRASAIILAAIAVFGGILYALSAQPVPASPEPSEPEVTEPAGPAYEVVPPEERYIPPGTEKYTLPTMLVFSTGRTAEEQLASFQDDPEHIYTMASYINEDGSIDLYMTEKQFLERVDATLGEYSRRVSYLQEWGVAITSSDDYREYTLEIIPSTDMLSILDAQMTCTNLGGMCQLFITGVDPEDWQVHLIYVNADTGEVKGDIHVPAGPADTEAVTFDWLDGAGA